MPTATDNRVNAVPVTLEEGRRILADLQRRAERAAYRLLGPGAGVTFWPTVERVVRDIREGLAKVDEAQADEKQ